MSQQRVFVWATETPGLMAALREQSNDSALLGRVETADCWTLPAERFPSHFRQ
nr:type IV pilus biogenesis protein PilM [Escherichia coli]